MGDPFQDPVVKDFLNQFAREGLPAMAGSGVVMALITGKLDPKLCLEIGAAVLLDKPIIICAPEGAIISEHLRRCADKIIPVGPGGRLSEQAIGQIEDAVYEATSPKPRQDSAPRATS